MINLAGTNWVLRFVTASASNIEASASWVDLGGSPAVVTPGAQNTAAITAATTTTFVPAPASGQTRNVKGAVIANTSVGASTLVTVQVFDGSVACQLARALLAPGARLALGEDGLWTHQSEQGAFAGIPVGADMYFDRSTAPAGWLARNGQLVSRATYADLFGVIGTRYSAGDGSTTFGVGDFQGDILRALDQGGAVDAGRVLGSYQPGAIMAHTHTISPANTVIFGGTGTQDASATAGSRAYQYAAVATGSTGGPENIMRNRAQLLCIKH